MKITIDVSEKNEGTAAPYWLILDPKQNMSHSVDMLITGPFFSREEAESVLHRTKYNYSHRAIVYCMSGCYTDQYYQRCKEVGLT